MDPVHKRRIETLSQVGVVDPVVVVGSISVEATAMDHAIITVDVGVVRLTGRRFHVASSPVSNALSMDCTLGASLIA